ncbi:MAG: NHLP family bacteriocin export ABC transporter peptidase/permease/ATPase subunit [Granulosicoccus sp.]
MKRARTPSVLQLEATECGAACLAMVLGYFGRHEPLDELRNLCGVSRDGAKASSLLRAARTFGLDCKGLKAEPDALGSLPTPMIAFVNFNHFLVVEGIRDDSVFINDPANGHRRESMAEFAKGFTGVVLTFERGESFKPGDSRPSLARSLIARVRPFRMPLCFALLMSLLLVVPALLLPFLSQVFIDYVLVRSLSDWLQPLLIIMAAAAGVMAVFGLVRTLSLIDLGEAMQMQTSAGLMRHLMQLPISFFEQRHTGEIVDRVQLNESLVSLLTNDVIQMVLNLLLAVFFLIVMFSINTTLSLMVLLLATLNIVVLVFTTPMFSEQYRKMSIDAGKLNGAVVSGLKDIETFKATGAEDLLFTRWTGLRANVINSDQHIAGLNAWIQPVPNLLLGGMGLVTLIGGAHAAMSGQMTLGELIAFQALALSFTAPVVALAHFGSQLQELRSFTGRLDDTLQQSPDASLMAERPTQNDRLPGGWLVLDDVSFGYNPLEQPLINGLNLEILSGRRVALVGPSGSGKSTVGKLIGGLVSPVSGRILIDGEAHDTWARDVLASRLAYVQQDISLFAGTIRDNIRLWDNRIPDADVQAAARDAGIHEMITARPGGYGANVVEGASNLSGGERQRIEIARALATNPAVIILDEATSALDPTTELSVMEAIRRRGITCIVIAHRLSAIRDCDEILVLDNGIVVERGTHTTLMQSQGHYAGLLDA